MLKYNIRPNGGKDMTAVYPDKEINSAFKQRKKLLVAYWTCFAALAIALIALFVVHYIRVDTELDRSYQSPFMWASIILSSLFAIGSVFFFGVKYRYTKAYCRMYRDMIYGPKDKSRGEVLEIVPELNEKYAIKFHGVKVKGPPVRRGEENIRLLLIEKDHEIPELQPGVKFEFIAQSNIILGYEIKDAE